MMMLDNVLKPCMLYILLTLWTTSAKSPISVDTTHHTISKNKTSDPSFTNNVAPSDSYSMYRHLMEVKDDMMGEEKGEREPRVVVKTVKKALQILLEAVLQGLVKGFLPHFERQRREASDDKSTYLDLVVNTVGALLGKQGCSEKIACRF